VVLGGGDGFPAVTNLSPVGRVEEALAIHRPGFFYEQSLMFRVAARDD
jgi:hypothetical protein